MKYLVTRAVEFRLLQDLLNNPPEGGYELRDVFQQGDSGSTFIIVWEKVAPAIKKAAK